MIGYTLTEVPNEPVKQMVDKRELKRALSRLLELASDYDLVEQIRNYSDDGDDEYDDYELEVSDSRIKDAQELDQILLTIEEYLTREG